jgi:putative transposase
VDRAYRLLLQPTARQRSELTALIDSQRLLYNAAVEERRGAWRWEGRSVTKYDQFKELTGWDDPTLRFGVTVARGTLTRLDEGFGHFYRRVRRGETPGFPRFKSKARFDSVQWCDRSGWKLGERLRVFGIGELRYRRHKRWATPAG